MGKFNENIVLVGGGGGVYRIARFLKNIRPNITTNQTVFDYGGHSARLRDERGVLPPGDIRQAILALSSDSIEPILRDLLAFRFSKRGDSSLNDATIGNLLLTALTEITGNLPAAIDAMCKLYQVQGTVLPVSLDHAHLVVTLNDGTVLKGEGDIDKRSTDDDRVITSARLEPNARIYTKAYEALVKADKIVFCPGDFWTSLIPNVLVDGFAEAVRESRALKIMVVNIMTKKSETHGYASDTFASMLSTYLGVEMPGIIDVALCNTEPIPPEILTAYEREHAYPVKFIEGTHAQRWIGGRFADWTGGIIRHHEHVVSAIADL